MKKILLFIFVLISINSIAQFPATQSMANASTRLLVNGGLEAKRGIINGVFTDTSTANADNIDFYNGAQIYTRSDRNFWLRDSVLNMWVRMAKFTDVSNVNIYNSDGILTADRTLTGLNNTNGLLFDSLDYFEITRAGISRLLINTSVSNFLSANGGTSVGISNNQVTLDAVSTSNYLHIKADSSIFHKRASYEGNIHSTFFPYSLVDKSYVDSVAGAGSGTVNSGTTGKPAYYVGATTLDDFTPIDYSLTGAHQKITAQNTTDTNLVLKATSVQTAPLLSMLNSGGTVVARFNANGHLAVDGGSVSDAGFYLLGSVDYMGIFASNNTGAPGFGYVRGAGTKMLEFSQIGNFFATQTGPIGWGNPSLFGNANYMYMGPSAEGIMTFSTESDDDEVTLNLSSGEAAAASITLDADDNDDATDRWKLSATTTGDLTFTNNSIVVARLVAGGGVTLPEQAAPSTPASATAVMYVKSDGLFYGKADDGIETKLSNGGGVTISKGLTLEFPTSTENYGVWKTPVAITISSVTAVLLGSASPSVTLNIAFGTDRTSGTNVFSSGTAITNTTTGQTLNSGFNDATIPAGSFIWFVSTAQSGTVTQIEVTINYTED